MKTRHKIALARAAHRLVRTARRAIGSPMLGVFQRGGIRWALDLNEGIDFSIFLLGAFEPRTVRAYRRLIRPGDTVLDIGANMGAHTLFFARLVGDGGRVLAFEPTDYAFEKLRANLELNPQLAARVLPLHMVLVAATDDAAPSELYSGWPLTGGRALHPEHLGQAHSLGAATTSTLDALMAGMPDLRPSWVKLDVDGNELSVLRGARSMLERFRPRLIMELSPYVAREAGHDFADLLSLVTSLGYEIRALQSGRRLPPDTAELERLVPVGSSINVLLSPS